MNMFSMQRIATIAICLALICVAETVQAQMDRVYTFGSDNASAGAVIEATKNGIKLKTGRNEKAYTQGEIRKIVFQGDPRELTRAREFAIDGQYQQALDEMKGLDLSKIPRDVIQADAAYYLTLCQAKLALAGQGDRNAAIGSAVKFAGKYRDSYHFYSAAKLLGDLALATKAYDKAIQYYGALSKAPSTETKIESRYLTGIALLEKGDVPAAQKSFADVAAVNVQSVEALRLKSLAKAGQAVALAKGGKGKEAMAIVETLVTELNPTDIELAARIYNAQGQSYEASGDLEGAIMSYLHTHLMFSGQPDAHGHALSRLVELWPQVGRAERAAEARQELQQRYPGLAN